MRGSGPCGARRLVTAPSMAGGKGCRPGRGAWLMTISMVLSDNKQCKRGKRVGRGLEMSFLVLMKLADQTVCV